MPKRIAVYHTAPRKVEAVEEPMPPLADGQLLVEAVSSAISAGTELLFYRGQIEKGLALDPSLASLRGRMRYPFKYGYASVGHVVSGGADQRPFEEGARVFSFHPHESAYAVTPTELVALPDDLSDDDALFFASMETAVSVTMDASPLVGEDVIVLGQGTIGLLATGLLARHPLSSLIAIDPCESRRSSSLATGATAALDPGLGPGRILDLTGLGDRRADLVVELSGNPKALDLALRLVGKEGRVVIGSWYGSGSVTLALGTDFHRGRVRLISSQVSSIGPGLTGRWDKARRYGLVLRLLAENSPSRLISHRFPVAEVGEAFSLLDSEAEGIGQVVLEYRRDDG